MMHHSETILYEVLPGEHKKTLVVNQGAVCTLVVRESLELSAIDFCKIELYITLLQDAQLYMNFAFLHAQHVECVINIHLEGERSVADVQGLYALNNHQKVSIHTYQYHSGAYSKSNLVVKGMLQDYAQATYAGLIKIDEFAKGVVASQENKNILLSAQAKVISVPSIEVLNYDVQCCHGSAIGKFDQDDMWYLQSKGLLLEQAQELLTRSFFQDVLREDGKRDEIMDVVCMKMKSL